MEFELSQQEVHCVYDARTPDCLDKDLVTLKQLLPLLLIVGYFLSFNAVSILSRWIRPSGIVQLHTGWQLLNELKYIDLAGTKSEAPINKFII